MDYKRNKRLNCFIVTVQAVLSLFASMGCVVAAAESVPVLQGKVEDHNRVTRLPRPKMPALPGKADETVGVQGKIDGFLSAIDSGRDDPRLNFKRQVPQVAPTGTARTSSRPSRSLEGGDSSAEMVIAWERWHKRVASVLFENWKSNSTLIGKAHTEIRVSRERHITMRIFDIRLSSENNFPVDNLSLRQQAVNKYRNEVYNTIAALDGAELLEFPAGSQRSEVVFSPSFTGGDEADYDWRHDDYERVPVR